MDILAELMGFMDDDTRREGNIVHAPFGYHGGKTKSLKHILPHLPYRESYIEVFGGSGAVLLARRASKLEVYNDRYGGVVSFYRCLRDEKLLTQLIERLKLTPFAREEFTWSKKNWDVEDPVERAARWYWMCSTSFAGQSRNFGRSLDSRASKRMQTIDTHIKDFWPIHERIRHVQIENLDWRTCLKDYDNPDAVFYCDPPYLDTYHGYTHGMSESEHGELLDRIHDLQGFVALSGGPGSCRLYDLFDWDDRVEWERFESVNNQNEQKELLWIKEAVE